MGGMGGEAGSPAGGCCSMPAAPLPSSIAAALSMDSPPAACCVAAACCAAACCAICNCCGVKPCMLPAGSCALLRRRPCLLQRAAAVHRCVYLVGAISPRLGRSVIEVV